MDTDAEALEAKTDRELYGRILGIVKNRHQLNSLCESLAGLGVRDLEVLDGPIGVQRLVNWHETASQFFFGDMEAVMLQRYVDAAGDGLLVFTAVVAPELANPAAEMARSQGATEVVHFGNSVITSY